MYSPLVRPGDHKDRPYDASLGVTFFDRTIDDLIQFEQNAGFARAENVGKARLTGVEVEMKSCLFNHLSLAANYTFQNPRDHANYDGKLLPGRPRHEFDGKLEAFNKKGKLFTAFNWMDDICLDPLNTRKVNDRILVNAGASVKALPKTTVSFEAKNLTDSQTVDVVGFPLPGRSFFGKVDWEW